MASITFDHHFVAEKSPKSVVRLQPKQALCTCGRTIVVPEPVEPEPVEPEPVETEARVKRPRFEGQWRTLLYI